MSRLLIGLATVCLAACQPGGTSDAGSPPVEPVADTSALPDPIPPASDREALPGNDTAGTNERDAPPPPVLSAMTYDEFSARIPSGTGCSFTPEGPDKPTLMIATAPIENDARAQAVIKLDATVRILRSKAAGGYDRLREGAVLTNDQGVSVTVVRAKGEGQPEGIESTVWPATMTVRAAPDRERTYKGSYSCGA